MGSLEKQVVTVVSIFVEASPVQTQVAPLIFPLFTQGAYFPLLGQ